jgi:Damage-control phosphatase ARMT1-like domain
MTQEHQSQGQCSAKPLLPLPEPIYSATPGTWAYDTMSRRVDGEILQRTWEDNRDAWSTKDFEAVVARFDALRCELQQAETTKLTYLDDSQNAGENQIELQEWHQILQPFVSNGDTWLSAPWMVSEFYVYRRLMQAIGYFDPTSAGYLSDPFLKQKRAGLLSSVGSAEPVLAKIPQLPATKEGLEIAAGIALWGNKMDLSLWPADAKNANLDVFTDILNQAHENLLHDDGDLLAAHCDKLREKGGGQVSIIVDNAGFELVTDLALAQYLVESKIAKTVTFQLKSHPTFVSDALEKDLLETVEHYQKLDALQFPHAQAAGTKWRQFLDQGQWICHEHRFWVQPFAMWDMTEPLRTDLATNCDLAFVKGDANYRRLLGDRKWDYTAPFQDVVGAYFPCPVCALRTLKAELGCGMDADQVERARKLDDSWMVNGRFGVVQFGTGAGR